MEEPDEVLIKELLKDLGVAYDLKKVHELTEFLECSFSERDCEIFYGYLTARISIELLSDNESPVQQAMSGAMEILLSSSEALSQELLILAAHQQDALDLKSAEIENQKLEISSLLSENKALRSSLTRLRKLLKADEVKDALSFCEKLRKQSVSNELGQKALLLGESIKNALIAIKGV